MAEYIERDMFLKIISHKPSSPTTDREDRLINGFISAVKNCPAADVRPVPEGGIGEMSDGYHTFNGLYYQRMVLFAALVKAHKDKAWKSWKHEDGNPCFGGGWFIVGIDTPEGSYTYHYDKMYWNLFECKELPTAKHWDGHTEKDVTRLLSLDVRPVVRGKWIKAEVQPYFRKHYNVEVCSVCQYRKNGKWNYCPNCGADMREVFADGRLHREALRAVD